MLIYWNIYSFIHSFIFYSKKFFCLNIHSFFFQKKSIHLFIHSWKNWHDRWGLGQEEKICFHIKHRRLPTLISQGAEAHWVNLSSCYFRSPLYILTFGHLTTSPDVSHSTDFFVILLFINDILRALLFHCNKIVFTFQCVALQIALHCNIKVFPFKL